MAQSRQEAAGSLDHMLLANVLSILEHQVGTGALSSSAAYDIYLAIAKDLRVALSTKEIESMRHRLETAEVRIPDI
ncbi:MAG: hypothetical protein JWQ61_2968 [Collimonas fungivorans]|uniref:hypothetical protein n=1 Tax=Collimonas fungivorans TaxID=158899 RepID=UPI0026E9DD80|nr:hypothetical protein [Collimonas fungivorans]MDB5768154.1 hypothetical protein [Collimonas fungivorans]